VSAATLHANLGLQCLARGDVMGAVEMFKQSLGEEPDNAEVHSYLSICLLQLKRVHAAGVESAIALQLDPMSRLSLSIAARVAIARNQLEEAEELAERAVAADPEHAGPLRLQADLCRLRHRPTKALELLTRARALDPEDVDTLSDLARIHLDAGRLDQAEELAREALAMEAGDPGALVVMGHIFLSRGDLDAAHDQAVWVLSNNPDNTRALTLIASIKARRNPVLGLWWRYHTWMSKLGQKGVVVALLGAYMVYRVVAQATEDLGHANLSEGIEYAWLGVCAFTWFGPVIFKRMVDKELGRVELDPDF